MDFYIEIVIGALVIIGIIAVIKARRSNGIKTSKVKRNEIPTAINNDKQTPETSIDQFVEVEARVYDNGTRQIYNSMIPAAVVRQIRKDFGNLGRKWLRDGRWVYALNKTDSGTYRPVQVPKTLGDPPSELHRALQQQETAIVFNVEEPQSVIQKYGIYIWVGVITAVAIFVLIGNQIQVGGG